MRCSGEQRFFYARLPLLLQTCGGMDYYEEVGSGYDVLEIGFAAREASVFFS